MKTERERLDPLFPHHAGPTVPAVTPNVTALEALFEALKKMQCARCFGTGAFPGFARGTFDCPACGGTGKAGL